MGWSNNIFPLLIITPTGGFTGLFVYSPGPGSGNLIASIASAAGTDPYGNHFNPGITSYDNTFGGVTNINGAAITLFSGVTERALLNPAHFTVLNSHGATIYDVDLARAAQFLYADTGSATQGGLVASQSQNTGTDQFGNAYKAGITSYNTTTPFPFTDINSGVITLGSVNLAIAASLFVTATAGTNAGLSITSGAGTEAGATASTIALGDSGSGQGGSGLYVKDGRDSTNYGTERLIQTNTLNVTLSNTVFTSVFGGTPVAATAYVIKADLLITVGTTAAALIFQLVGPAVAATTDVKWRVTFEAGTGESVFAGHSVGNLSSFTAPSTTFPANSVVHVWLSAYVTFSAASGTNLNLQAELSAASAGSNVSLGSTLEVMPV